MGQIVDLAQCLLSLPRRLENHFGTHKDVDVVMAILEKGELQHASE